MLNYVYTPYSQLMSNHACFSKNKTGLFPYSLFKGLSVCRHIRVNQCAKTEVLVWRLGKCFKHKIDYFPNWVFKYLHDKTVCFNCYYPVFI